MTFSSLLSIRSHPVRVRGLKLALTMSILFRILSHPMRVRGLKHPPYFVNLINNIVAPHVGAWIETEF